MPTVIISETLRNSYRYSGRTVQTADGSWLASVFAVAVLVSLDPKGPAEVEAAPPEGGASLYSAGWPSEGPSAAGAQTCHWPQTGLSEVQSDSRAFLFQNCDALLADPE